MFVESLFEKLACGKPYMPFVTSMCTIPDLLTVDCSLYSSIISWGKSLIFTQMNSVCLSGVIR